VSADGDFLLLRVLSLKGMAGAEIVAGALRAPDYAARLASAVEQGLVRELPRGYALTPQGRESVRMALEQPSEGLDIAAITQVYDQFCVINGAFKSLMHRWQLRMVDGQEVPNDHTDSAYEAAIIADLGSIDDKLQPILRDAAIQAPRLQTFKPRFADALAAVRAGDKTMMARPLVDSYHTVWFELHEELIALSGRTRADEAAAGRGD